MDKIHSAITPADKLWMLIEVMKKKTGLTDTELALAARTTTRTVRNDRKNPAKMTAERMLAYMSYVLHIDDVCSAISNRMSEKLPEVGTLTKHN